VVDLGSAVDPVHSDPPDPPPSPDQPPKLRRKIRETDIKGLNDGCLRVRDFLRIGNDCYDVQTARIEELGRGTGRAARH
jgi:hypothetical protein